MKVLIFGATGGVGQHVLNMTLKKGYEVSVFVRSPEKLTVTENVTIIQGDAFNAQQVADAIKGQDVVMSCLGSSGGMKKSNELETMGKNIADGMVLHNVQRLVYCASAGINREIPGLTGKMVMKLLENPLKDHRAALDYYLSKNITYTIARPMGLKNDPLSLTYRESFDSVPPKAGSIARASVAHFMVKAIEDPTYENKSVGISN